MLLHHREDALLNRFGMGGGARMLHWATAHRSDIGGACPGVEIGIASCCWKVSARLIDDPELIHTAEHRDGVWASADSNVALLARDGQRAKGERRPYSMRSPV